MFNRCCVVIFLFIGFACEEAVKWETIVLEEEQIAIEIPSYLTERSDLSNLAIAQFGSVKQDVFLLIIAEEIHTVEQFLWEQNQDSATAFVQQYAHLMHGFMGEQTTVLNYTMMQDTVLFNAIRVKAELVLNDQEGGMSEILYHIAYVKGKSKYYQIFSWTSLANQTKNAKVLDQILGSFKEL